MSTCDGLSGLLLHGGKNYRVEELAPPPRQQHHRHHRPYPHGDPDSPLLVIFPFSLAPTTTSDTANLTRVWSDAHAETPHTPAVEVHTHVLGHRRTRAVRRRVTGKSPSKYMMELAVYIDDSLVSHVKKRYPTANPKKKAEEIVMTLLNVVNRVFSDPSLGAVSVKLVVRKLKFLGAGVVSEAAGDGNAYLGNFCVWQAESTSKRQAKHWDHALLLTGVDLYSDEPQYTSTTGMSFIGGMCSHRHSCSIVEGTKFTSAFTIAHEMGHSMNLVHDGEKTAATCSKTGHLMATSLNDGGHTWSSCSKKQLRDFLRKQGTCLAEEGGGGMLTYPIPDEVLPGRKFDADQQCHYMFGKGWSHAPDHQPNVCQEIWCYKGLKLRSPGVSPLDGTTCGRNKVCIKGRCQSTGAAKNRQYRTNKKKQSGGRRKKKMMKKIVKKLMKKEKKKIRPSNEEKDEVLEEVEGQNDEGRENEIGNARKDENDDDTSEEKTEEKIQTSSKYIKLLEKMLKEAKKSMNRTKKTKEKNNAKCEGKAKQEDEIMEITNNKTRETDINDQGDLRHDKDEKKQAKNKKLKQMIKQQVKKHLNSVNRRGKEKAPPRIRKIESPTQIIIKERLKYVKDKGWKVNVLKIKKKKLANRRVKVKDYTITCNGSQSKCRITTKQARKKNRVRQQRPNIPNRKVTRKIQNKRLPLNASKKTKVRLGKEKTTPVSTRKTALAREQCQPRKIKYVSGKGWLVKVSHDCFKLHERKKGRNDVMRLVKDKQFPTKENYSGFSEGKEN
ncbi:uncharacterized protein LOC135093220 isoform X2 [Scylla paramamosain]